MAVKLIQAITIKSSKEPIEMQKGCHLKKIKGTYYLIKNNTIELNFKNNNHERKHNTK
jgi:hypothetical protein